MQSGEDWKMIDDDEEEEIGSEMFFCSEAGCSKVFTSRGGRDKHVRRKHRLNSRIPCKHGCGKNYVDKTTSLRFHERTCDMNPDAQVGAGIMPQQYNATSRTTTTTTSSNGNMNLIQTSHANNFRLYRKQIGAKSNIQEHLKHAIMHDGLEVLQRETINVKFMFTV